MTATQAPTPGPLDSEGVKLLVKGDLLRGIWDGSLWSFNRLSVSGLLCVDGPIPHNQRARDEADSFAFIGRPDADGWMPWSGGENPVGDAVVEVKCRDGSTGIDTGSMWQWDSEYAPIIAFRLAPTAPVEASGSELHPATADLVDRFAAELKSKLAKAEAKYGYRDNWSRPDWEDELTESLAEHIQKGDPRDVAAYCAFAWHHGWSTSDAAGYFAPALRPQPGGETREAACSIPPAGWTCSRVAGHDGPCAASPINTHEAAVVRGLRRWLEWDFDGADKQFQAGAKHVLNALHDARPLALGGQNSGGSVGLAANEIGAHIAKRDAEYEAALADLTIKPDASSLDEFGRSIFGALSDCPAMSLDKQADFVARALWPVVSTTPARAEAQDEGAAGEREALALDRLANAAEVVRRLLHKTKEVQGPSFREAGISFSTAIDHARAVLRQRDALLAHPSPTPAADADRVRIAVGALEVKINAPLTGPTHGAWDRGRIAGLKEALAALKSEGK